MVLRLGGYQESGPAASKVSSRVGPEGLWWVEIAGYLPVGWLGSLSFGVAQAGLSIVRGRARRTERRRWEVQLEIDPRGTTQDPAHIDYLALAAVPRGQAPSPIVIDSYDIQRHPNGRSLVLDFEGVDQVGFLGSLLDRLTGLLLFPVELEIETIGTRAVDRLCLQALGGRTPSVEAETMLAALLDGLRPASAGRSRGLSPARPALPAPADPAAQQTFLSPQ